MKFHNIRAEILKFVKKNKVVTTSELASYFKISWNSCLIPLKLSPTGNNT